MDDSSHSKFEYDALPDDSEYIRLFEICTKDVHQPDAISCHLSTWKVDQAPSYHAISYTWGDTEVTESICLNDRTKDISKNCADVLRQLQYFKTSKYYWIDAICIDQSATSEKSHQVANMGYVFERAERVLACLGMDDEECEYAMSMMDEIERYYEHSERSPTKLSQLDKHGFKPSNFLLSQVPGMDIARFSFAVLNLSNRPYFFRVWILQELLLAKQISFCFGHHIQPRHIIRWHFHHANGVHDRIRSYETNVIIKDLDTLDPREYPQTLVDAVNAHGEDRSRDYSPVFDIFGLARPGSSNEHKISFGRGCKTPSELVSLSSSRFCHDPRDTIYGTLALTNWGGRKPVVPDYTKSNFDLAVEYLRYIDYEDAARSLLANLKVGRDTPGVKTNIDSRNKATFRCDLDAAPTQNSFHKHWIEAWFRGKKLETTPEGMCVSSEAVHNVLMVSSSVHFEATNITTVLPLNTVPGDFIVWSDDDVGPEALILRPIESGPSDGSPVCEASGPMPAASGPEATILSSLPTRPVPSAGLSDPTRLATTPPPKSPPRSDYSIIGRAWMPRGSDFLPARFKIFFDPEDFAIYGATSQDPNVVEGILHQQSKLGMYEGPLAPVKQLPDADDMENLSIPVCRKPLSSFAVRLEDREALYIENVETWKDELLAQIREGVKEARLERSEEER